MKPYIFTERNGIHIIDLQKTIAQLKIAYNAIKELAKSNGTILFVGTKRQAQAAIVEEAIQLKNKLGSPKVIWMQLGIVNEEAARRAKEAGFKVVMDRCMMREHKLLNKERAP